MSSHPHNIEPYSQIYNVSSDIDVSVLSMESKQTDVNLPKPPPFYDNLFPCHEETVHTQESHMV